MFKTTKILVVCWLHLPSSEHMGRACGPLCIRIYVCAAQVLLKRMLHVAQELEGEDVLLAIVAAMHMHSLPCLRRVSLLMLLGPSP